MSSLRLNRHAATALFAVLALTAPLNARAKSNTAAAAIRIDNFGRVDAGYYRGSQPEGHDYADLAALGVKTVINLTSDESDPAEPSLVRQAGMKYVAIPMTTRQAPTSEQIAAFMKVVDDPSSAPVYVHCVGGRHRTGVMTAVYRMTNDGWTADQAFNEMKHYKFGMDFLHPEFKQFVYAYLTAAAPSSTPVVATQITTH